MKFSPYSMELLPVALPNWQSILDDLGNPHPACIALFWLTRWGRSIVDCAAFNDCQLAVQYANSLERELRATRAQLARALAIGEFSNGRAAADETEDRHPR